MSSLGHSTLASNLHVAGTLSAGSLRVPDSTITDDMVSATADIDADKVEHRHTLIYQQSPAAAVGAATIPLWMCAAGDGATIVSIKAAITDTVATGADRTVTITLQKAAQAGSWATLAGTTITFNNTTTLLDVSGSAPSVPGLIQYDMLQLVVAVAGAAGNQAKGLLVRVEVDEMPG
jgi:hypothetical protein